MPGTTTGGLPYPLSTEPVRDGAVAIQNLANAVGSRFTLVAVNATTDGNGRVFATCGFQPRCAFVMMSVPSRYVVPILFSVTATGVWFECYDMRTPTGPTVGILAVAFTVLAVG